MENEYQPTSNGFTAKQLEDLFEEIKAKYPTKHVMSTGVGGCEKFVELYGTAMFITAVQMGSLIPAGEEAMEYYEKCLSGEINVPGNPWPTRFDPTEPFYVRNVLSGDSKITLTNGVERGSKFTPKKKKRK